jgi:tRNA (guanine-N7-)-methyltransferase
MSKSGQLRVSRTKAMPSPNEYVLGLLGEYSQWSYDEERAPKFRGVWRTEAFGVNENVPMDIEIGTGNGLHFAHHAIKYPERCLLGLELRYKPLIQSVRRALRGGRENMRIARYNAALLNDLFIPGEVNDVYIFFPDPWTKKRQQKHRLIQDEFLVELHKRQRPGSKLIFKTDSRDYFDWSLTRFQRSPYKMLGHTYDLHNSEFAETNFVTQFENIFIRQGLQIGYALMERV